MKCLIILAAALSLAACGSDQTCTTAHEDMSPSNQICLFPSKSDGCLGSASCDGDNKDCSPALCSMGGGRNGVCVARHCYWFDPGASGGTASCFVPPVGDACSGWAACADDNKDCKPEFCSTGGGRYGVCLAKRCYWFDPATP